MRLLRRPIPSRNDHKTVTARGPERSDGCEALPVLGTQCCSDAFFSSEGGAPACPRGSHMPKIDRVPFTDGRLAGSAWGARERRVEYGECVRFRRKKAVRSNLFCASVSMVRTGRLCGAIAGCGGCVAGGKVLKGKAVALVIDDFALSGRSRQGGQRAEQRQHTQQREPAPHGKSKMGHGKNLLFVLQR